MTDYSDAKYIAVTPTMGGGRFGKGYSVAEAKRNLKEFGGNLNHVIVYRFPEGSTNGRIDPGWGFVWDWEEDYDGDPENLGEEIEVRGLS